MQSLREDGLAKAAAGRTSLDELVRVAPDDAEADENACPVCAHPVEPEFANCPWCGNQLGLPTCHGCERTLEPGWRMCPDCATPVEDGTAATLVSAGAAAGGGAAAADARAPSRTHALPSPLTTSADPEDRPLILVVDDDPSVRAALQTMLGSEYDVDTASDAASAVEKMHREQPDLLLLDVGLPDRDGYALTRELRSRSTTMDIPIVILTGTTDQDGEMIGLHAGADDHLTKPVDPDILLARLEAVLRRRTSHRVVHQMPVA
jgi:CheY-like chemotaxis protein